MATLPFLLAALAALPQDAVPKGQDVLCLKDGRIIADLTLVRAEGGIRAVFQNGEVLVPEALVQDAVIAADALVEPTTDEEKENAAKGYVRFEGKWVHARQREAVLKKRVEERRKSIEEIKAHQVWRNRYKVSTKHFDFEHTLSPHVFEYYRDLMEAYFADFAKQWKVTLPKDGRVKVCFYVDEDAYYRTSGAPRGAIGYFRFVKPMELNFYYDLLDPRETELVLFHEANHYLQKLVDLDFKVPHFPGESLAEYYGASTWDPVKKKIEVGLVQEGRLVEIQNDIASGKFDDVDTGPVTGGGSGEVVAKPGDLMDLKTLIETEGMYQHYTWGWSLVHFLMSDRRYQKKFQDFFLGLAKGRDVKREPLGLENLKTVSGAEILAYFNKSMGLRDEKAFRALEKEWHEYVRSSLKAVTPRGLEQAAFSAAQTGRPLRAKRLFGEAIEAGSTNPVAFHRYAELLMGDGKKSEAIALWEKAIALDPMSGRYHAALGRALARSGKSAEGQRLVKLAREISPDDPELDRYAAEVDLGEK